MVFDLPHFSVWNLALHFQFLKLCTDEKGHMQTLPGSLASFAPNSPIIDLGGTKQGIQKVCYDNDGFESFLKPELDELLACPPSRLGGPAVMFSAAGSASPGYLQIVLKFFR